MAPTVVLLHAFPLDKRMWDDVVGPIADAGWDVVVPDLLGFGESRLDEDDLDDEPTLAAQARDVLSILDRIGLSNVVVCGLSLGGYVAMELVRQDPLAHRRHRARRHQGDGRHRRGARQPAARRRPGARVRLDRRAGARDAADAARRDHARDAARGRRAGARLDRARPTRPAWRRAQRAMAARPDSLADLASLAVPGLVLWGAEDTLCAARRAGPHGRGDARRPLRRDPRVRPPRRGRGARRPRRRRCVTFLRDVENLPRHT